MIKVIDMVSIIRDFYIINHNDMNFNPNLKLDEVMYRYMIMMAIVITGGALQNYWFVFPAMAVFLTAILGWDPIKAYRMSRKERPARSKNIVLTHRHAH